MLAMSLLFALTACGSSNDSSSGDSLKGSAKGSSIASSESADVEGKGKLGDYGIEIISAEKGRSKSKKDVLIVTYKFTNNSEDEKSFSLAFNDNAFQSGVKCLSATLVDGVDAQLFLFKVKPGASLELKRAYQLSDLTSDVKVEISELISSASDEKVTKTFKIQ